ncbi:N-acetylglucosamine-6-phosphate deacetylase [Pleionea litopenaei]|uniref:N-acetylglucosamine-6-phosphate deacetylase n=1 Tax=Pleionea litopenaei TaxID=3070815 RepID=A0AA51RS57_9GAMM|nr:N-acetylglucosamine-6-phosphate deacetylase [Pleionea sp. HL-JVS1]WMS86658.1 N-acetylglucosamine-6-phosphate deacetylase [Pleionea sp. HL-JVS1]
MFQSLRRNLGFQNESQKQSMEQKYFIKHLFTGERWLENAVLVTTNGKVSVLTDDPIEVAAAKNKPMIEYLETVIPGFIDIQVNGGGGELFNQNPSVNALESIAATHQRFGTTSWLPTVITDQFETMERAANAVAEARKNPRLGILGVHFEGPGIATSKKGAHSQGLIRALERAELELFTRDDLGVVVVTLAPETVPADQIEWLTQRGVIVCLGHSNANADEVIKAIHSGAKGFTHLFNAMSPLTSREPGMVGVALHSEKTFCGIIVDGFHVHPLAISLAYRLKTANRLILVTDAMAPTGTDLKRVEFFDREIVRDGDRLTSTTGELAGSVLTMNQAFINAMEWLDIPIEMVSTMSAKTPATFLGIEQEYGHLEVGCHANFIALDSNFRVLSTWVMANNVYTKQ